MSRVGITCPLCHGHFEMQSVDATTGPKARRQPNGQITPLTNQALADILEVLQSVGAGQKTTSAELYRLYREVVTAHGRKRPLTQYAVMIGVKRYGAEPWRSRYFRGYVLPETLPSKPLGVEEKARERMEAADYRDTVLDHRGTRPAPAEPKVMTREELLAELPFEIDIPDDMPLNGVV